MRLPLFIQMDFLVKLGCVFVFSGEQMKPDRSGTDLLYMTYIISVLKKLFGHGIFAFFAFHISPWMFLAPCKELSTICSHASLQLNMLLKHVEPHWCPGGNHLPVKQKRTLLPARLLAAPGFTASASPTTSTILPRQPLLIQDPGESLFKSLLCPRDLRVSSDTNRRVMRPEEEPSVTPTVTHGTADPAMQCF